LKEIKYPKKIKFFIMIYISIIIVNWNTKDYLIKCLKSLVRIRGGSSQEVIIIDNASQDESVRAVRESFPQFILIENPKNLGFAKAVNKGLKIAKGEYILLLNPDIEIKDNTIEKFISFMEAYQDVGIAGAQLLNDDGSKQNSIANFPSLVTELFNKSLLRWFFPKYFPGKEQEYTEPIEVDSVIGACMMVRRKAIEDVGLLDEDYFLFFEETDWCYRMKKAGWKVYHVPQAQVFHFQGKSAEKDKKKAKVEYYHSRYLFFKKYKGYWQFIILRVGLLLKLVIEFLFMGIGCIMTGFKVKRWKTQLSNYAYLFWWHMKGCPEEMGLK